MYFFGFYISPKYRPRLNQRFRTLTKREMGLFGKSRFIFIKHKFCGSCEGGDYGCENFDQMCERLQAFYGPHAKIERAEASTPMYGRADVSYSASAFAAHTMPLFASWNQRCADATIAYKELARQAHARVVAEMALGDCDMGVLTPTGQWDVVLDTEQALRVILELSQTLDITRLYIATDRTEAPVIFLGVSGRTPLPSLEHLSDEARDSTYLFRLNATSIRGWSGVQFDFDDGFGREFNPLLEHKHVREDLARVLKVKLSEEVPLLFTLADDFK